MGIETYLLIAACYGCGCYFSWRLGAKSGIDYAVKKMAAEIQKALGLSNQEMAQIIDKIKKQRQAKSA